MIRYFLPCFALIACLSCLPGCGGKTAEFDPKAAGEVTAEEQAEMDSYNEELESESEDMPAEYGS